MKTVSLPIAMALAFAIGGCSTIASSGSGNTAVNGEAWYVKTTHLLFIPVGNTIYYCPPATGRGSPVCVEAVRNEETRATQPAAPPGAYPPAQAPAQPAAPPPPAPHPYPPPILPQPPVQPGPPAVPPPPAAPPI